MGTTISRVQALGNRVHSLRSSRGLSLQEFATLVGLPASVLSELERGVASTPVWAVFAAAEALDVPVEALLSDHAVPQPTQPQRAQPLPVRPQHAPQAVAHAPVARAARVPRTFADLRTGPLADRTFDSLQQFAVAAVVEGGHPVSVIARIFRVPAWKLQGWADERMSAGAPVSVRGGAPRGGRPAAR